MTDGLLARARECEREGRHQDAAQALEEVLRSEPDHVEALYELAELGIESFRPAQAVEACRRGLRLAPDDFRFWMVLADAHLHRIVLEGLTGEETLSEARAALESARASCPPEDLAEILVVEAQERLLSGDREGARQRFAEAVAAGLPLEVDHLDIELNLVLMEFTSGAREAGRARAERLWHRVERWDEAHFHRYIPFQEYLWLVFRRELGENPPGPGRRPEEELDSERFRDKTGYRAIRDGLRRVRAAPGPGELRAACDEMLGFLRDPGRGLCVVFSTLKLPYLVEALEDLRG